MCRIPTLSVNQSSKALEQAPVKYASSKQGLAVLTSRVFGFEWLVFPAYMYVVVLVNGRLSRNYISIPSDCRSGHMIPGASLYLTTASVSSILKSMIIANMDCVFSQGMTEYTGLCCPCKLFVNWHEE